MNIVNSREDCLFCNIIAKKIPAAVIEEDPQYIAILDAFPVADGHTLLISRKHHDKIHNLPDETLSVMLPAAKKIVSKLMKILTFTDYNLFINNGKDAGQTIGHVHLHVVPRIAGDNIFPFRHGAPREAAYFSDLLSRLNNQ